MAVRDNGGSAFPRSHMWHNDTDTNAIAPNGVVVPPFGVAHIFDPGMTLRDHFAEKAMQSIYERAMVEAAAGSGLFSDPDWRLGLALDAYAMADAMIKARAA